MSEVDLQQNNSDSKDADRNLNSDADSQSVTTPTVSNTSEGSAKNKTPAPDGPESQSQNHEELSTVESHPQNTDNGLGVDGDKQLIETTADGENSEIKDDLNDLQSAKTKEQSNATQDDSINQQNESVSSENVTESTQSQMSQEKREVEHSVEADAYRPKPSPDKTEAFNTDNDSAVCSTPSESTPTCATSEHIDNTISPTSNDIETTQELVVALPPTSSESMAPTPGTSDVLTTTSSSGAGTSTCQGATSADSTPSVYHVKWVTYKNNNVAIVTQNENGPCPLLAIINVLLLQGKIKLPAMVQIVTSQQLMEYLGDCILEQAPKVGNVSDDALLNYEQNMSDAMAVFHKLQTGLDVNVRFTGVADFEYTPECIVFDLLGIPLYHGWLVDPESPEVVAAISNCSYNQLVEKIIAQKNANKEELITEALIAESFLESSASQLTYHGLSELSVTVKEDELCVFFRNNHFCTLYKHKNELFLMVTDQGFLTEPNVVWETLSNVEGDCYFVDANFRNFTKPEPSTNPIPLPVVATNSDMQIDQDYLVALSLQQEQQLDNNAWPQQDNNKMPECQLSDHELALQLQAEEDRQNAALQQQQPPQQHQNRQQPEQQRQQSQDRDKKKSDCTLL